MYIHTRPPETIREFVWLPRKHEVVFDFPLEGTREGGISVTMVGETDAILQRALADVPAGIDVTVERIGAYPSDPNDISGLLTERQQEILTLTVELGYYDSPRRVSHQEIAGELELSAGTISEYLQKVEARARVHCARRMSAFRNRQRR